MKTNICSLFLVLTVFLTSSSVSLAQKSDGANESLVQNSSEDWKRVEELTSGVELEVKKKDGKKVKGSFVSATSTNLSLLHDGNSIEVDRNDIQRIYTVVKRSMAKAVAIGTAAGAAVGTGAGIAQASSGDDKGVSFAPLSFGVIGAGIGALVGALIGGGKKKQLIYEAK